MIDKKVRQIWIGGEIPPAVAASMATWQDRLPQGWGYELMDEAALELALGEDVMAAADVHKNVRYRANFLRLKMLGKLGGWYVDADTVLRDPAGLGSLPSADVVVGQWYQSGSPPAGWATRGQSSILDIYVMGARAGAPILEDLAARVPVSAPAAPELSHYLRFGRHSSSYAMVPSWHADTADLDPWAVHVPALLRRRGSMSQAEAGATLAAAGGKRLVEVGGGASSLVLAAGGDLSVIETSRRWALWLGAVLPEGTTVRLAPAPRGKLADAFGAVVAEEARRGGDAGAIVLDSSGQGRMEALASILEAAPGAVPVIVHDSHRDAQDIATISGAYGRDAAPVAVESAGGMVEIRQRGGG
jgi:hypothetical protein